jgi:hypothetical protein
LASGISCIKFGLFSNISANIAFAICRVYILLGVWEVLYRSGSRCRWDVNHMVGRTDHIHPENCNCSFAEMFENCQNLMQLIPKTQSYTLNHSLKKPKDSSLCIVCYTICKW